MKHEVAFRRVNSERMIQGIKVTRNYLLNPQGGTLGLKEAKDFCDAVRDGLTVNFPETLFRDLRSMEEFVEEINDWGGEAEVIFAEGSLPLTIEQLALKLALIGCDKDDALELANGLDGIEDASGSLRAVAKLMKEVE